MRVAILNYVWDADLETPDALLDRYGTLTGWAEATRQAGSSSTVVCQRFSVDADLERNGVVYRFRSDNGAPHPGALFRHADGLHAAALASRPDVVHVNGILFPQLVRRLRNALPRHCGLVVQDHGGLDPDRMSLARRAWIRRGLLAADALLVAAPGHEVLWRNAGVVPTETAMRPVMEASTTLAPVDRNEAREKTRISGSPALLWVGRLNANKDPITVIKGVGLFARAHQHVSLSFVYSDARLEPDLREEIERHPTLAGSVRLVGPLPHTELAWWYSAADLFVLGSHTEGSGYAAIEALACGAVPVLTDIPSFRELTGGENVGALWSVGDADSLASALGRVTATSLAPQRVAARSLFERRFSWEAIGRRAMDIYQEVRAAKTGG